MSTHISGIDDLFAANVPKRHLVAFGLILGRQTTANLSASTMPMDLGRLTMAAKRPTKRKKTFRVVSIGKPDPAFAASVLPLLQFAKPKTARQK